MRIAVVRQTYNPAGGAERFVSNALRQLALEENFQIEILARRWQPIKGVAFNKVDPFYLGSYMRDKTFAHEVMKEFAKGSYDITQSHERIPGCQIYRAGDGLHFRWLQLRQQAGDSILSSLMPYHRYTLSAERKMYEDSRLRFVICNSRMVENELHEIYPEVGGKTVLIYNAVDSKKFSPSLKYEYRNSVRDRLSIDERDKVLVFVGSGFKRKGVKKVLSALSALPKDVKAIFVGSDKHINRYKSFAKSIGVDERVRFVGQGNPLPFYGSADGFILPSLYDPLPNACMEAFASGLPVLTSSQCGASELITHGENGYSFDFFDDKAIKDSMLNWYEDLNEGKSLAEAARETILPFTYEYQTQKLLEIYKQIINRDESK